MIQPYCYQMEPSSGFYPPISISWFPFDGRSTTFASEIKLMKILRASTHAENGTIQLKVNGRVIDTSMGVYEEVIDCGQYRMEWEVTGKPNSSFGITVSSPVVAEYHLLRRLDARGKASGNYQFLI